MPRYTAETYDQLLVSGALSYASWLVDHYGRYYAATQLRDAAPEAGAAAIGRLLDQAERAAAAGAKLEIGRTPGSIRDRDIPLNTNLPVGCDYRYRVEVSWVNPDDNHEVTRTSYVCSDQRLSADAVYSEAKDEVEQGIHDRGYSAKGFDRVHPDDIRVNIISVERRE